METVSAYTRAGQIAQALREEIITGKYAVGDRITISAVAQRFNVSNTPVREAFRMLQGDFFITIDPYKGAVVECIGQEYINNIYRIQNALAFLLAEDVCDRLNSEQVEQLRKINERLHTLVDEGGTSDSFEQINHEFHCHYYCFSSNKIAYNTYVYYHNILNSFRRKNPHSRARIKRIIEEHEQIIDALEKKSRDLLAIAEKAHLDAAVQSFFEDYALS